MKLINDGLPEPIFLALQNDKYTPGEADYTPSSLNQPVYQRKLIREHGRDIEEPASGRIWALLGSAVHYMIELAGERSIDYICEKRYYGDIEITLGKFKIGAQVDIYDTSIPLSHAIFDMKTTSAYSVQNGAKAEWEQQLNVQRWCIWKETGEVVKSLNIVAIVRDWHKSKLHEPGYPQKQVVTIPINVWTFEQTSNWIAGKVYYHESAKLVDPEPCDEFDTWEKAGKWVVRKVGASRATRLYDTESDAKDDLDGRGKGFEMMERKGERIRCAGYCPVSSICPAWAKFQKENK